MDQVQRAEPDFLVEGRRLLQAGGRLPEAIRHLRCAIVDRPGLAEPYRHHGTALRASNDHGAAVRSLARACVLDPSDLEAPAQMARLAEAEGRLDDAIAAFESILERDPSHSYSWLTLFRVALLADRLPEWRDFHLDWMEKAGGQAIPRLLAARLHRHFGESRRGEELLLEGVSRYGAVPAWLDQLGVFQALDGRIDQAAESFSQACASAPDDVSIHRNRAALLLATGRTEQALRHLRTLAQSDGAGRAAPDVRGTLLTDLSTALRLSWKPAEAAEAAAQACRADPIQASSFIALGLAHASLGNWADALMAMRQAHVLNPDRADLSLALEACHRLIRDTGATGTKSAGDRTSGILEAVFAPSRQPLDLIFPDPVLASRRHLNAYADAERPSGVSLGSAGVLQAEDERVVTRPLFYFGRASAAQSSPLSNFLITSWGHAGAIWLAASMNLHPGMLVTVGADHPLECFTYYDVNRNYRAIDPASARRILRHGVHPEGRVFLPSELQALVPAAGRDPALFPRIVLEELIELAALDPAVKVVGNIHGLMIGPLFQSFRADPTLFDGRAVAALDLIRHPVPRTESAIRATIHYHLPALAPAIDSFIMQNSVLCRKLEREYGIDFSEPRARAALHVFRQGRQNQVWAGEIRQHPDIGRILLERLKTEPEYFAHLLHRISCGRIVADQQLLERVYTPENLNKGRRTPTLGLERPADARDQFAAWSPFEQAEFRRLRRIYGLDEVYGQFGYDFSFVG